MLQPWRPCKPEPSYPQGKLMKTSKQKSQAAHEAAMTLWTLSLFAITVRFSFWWSWNLNSQIGLFPPPRFPGQIGSRGIPSPISRPNRESGDSLPDFPAKSGMGGGLPPRFPAKSGMGERELGISHTGLAAIQPNFH